MLYISFSWNATRCCRNGNTWICLGLIVTLLWSISSISLSVAGFPYSDVDFLTPPPAILPYIIIDGYILRYRSKQNQACRRPADISNLFRLDFHMTDITPAMSLWRKCADGWSQYNFHRNRPICAHKEPHHTRHWQQWQEKEKRVTMIIIPYPFDSAWKVIHSNALSDHLVWSEWTCFYSSCTTVSTSLKCVISSPGFSSRKNQEFRSPLHGVIGTWATTDMIVFTFITCKSIWPMYTHEYTILNESWSSSKFSSDHTEMTA